MTSQNPLISWNLFPDFPSITADHVVPAMHEVIAASTRDLELLETARPSTWSGLLVPLERLTDRVTRTWGLASHLHAVRNSPEMRKAYTQAQPLVVTFFNRLAQSRPVYECLEALESACEFQSYSQALKRTISLLRRDAMLQGVGLDAGKRERFNTISQELAQLSTRFTNNVLDATQSYALLLTLREEVQGLPLDSLRLAATMARSRGHDRATSEDGPWAVTLDLPSFLSFMQYAERRDLREQVYRQYITRASSGEGDNSPLILRILHLRQEQARLLGFENFAGLSLQSKMAPSVDAIEQLLTTISTAAATPGQKDLDDLRQLAQRHGQYDELRPWDIMFWAERLKEERLGLREDELRPYFPLPHVLDALFSLILDLFGVAIVSRDNVPTWHKDVTYYDIIDESGVEIGGLFLDPYARPEEKRGGAWMSELVGRSAVCASAGEEVRLPIAYVNCNQRPPLDEQPSLMSFQEMTTLFHEFGHALQHTLTGIDHGFVSGISNIEWDAVELPSQFMENWCYEPDILKTLGRHYQTGAPLPEDVIDRLLRSRIFRAASNALRQVSFALTDLTLHTADPDRIDPQEVNRRIAQDIMPLPPLEEDRFLCSFSHIFAGGYAAGYYSYKWAEVLSADAFAAFREIPVEDRLSLGRRFRATFLALGGSRHPLDVFAMFRGRAPEPTALLRQEGLLPDDGDA